MSPNAKVRSASEATQVALTRTTDAIERRFGEGRRRTRLMGVIQRTGSEERIH